MSEHAGTNISDESIGRTIARNAAYVTLGQILLKVFGFLFGVFVVRQLGDEQYGRYSIAIAWVGLFSIFAELGVTQFAMREIARSGERAGSIFWNLIGIRLTLAVVGVVLIPAGALLVGYGDDIVIGVLMYALTFVISAFFAPLEAVLTANEDFGWVTALTIARQAIWLALGTVAMWLSPGFLWLIGVGLLAMIPDVILAAWVVRRRKWVEWSTKARPSEWPALIRGGLPFAVTTLALTIAFSIDTVLLSWFVSDSEVGWYNISYGLVQSLVTLLIGFSVAMVPTLTKVFAADQSAVARWYIRSTRLIVFLSVPVAVGGMLVARPLVEFLYTPDIVPAARSLAIIVWDVPLLMYAAACGNLTTAIGEERSAARINTVNAIANIALNLLLIPIFGMLGAAVVTVVTDLLATLQFERVLRRHLGVTPPLGYLGRVVLAAVGLGLAVILAGDLPVIWVIGGGAMVFLALAALTGAIGADEWALAQRLIRKGQAIVGRRHG